MSKLPKRMTPFFLNIDSKYAAMIYDGTKTMEFRTRRLPLDRTVYLVEDGVCTGYMLLSWEFRSTPEIVWEFAERRTIPFSGGGRAGITRKWLLDYAGGDLVYVYGIALSNRSCKPFRVNPSAPYPEESRHA